MTFYPDLLLAQPQRKTFVMVDSNNDELTGLTLTVALSKNGGAFAASSGSSGEIGSGWYFYDFTAAETDTPGDLAVKITAAGAAQQNLSFNVHSPVLAARYLTYTLTRSDNSDPIAGAQIQITSDSDGEQVIWVGTTDSLGVARDAYGQRPYLAPGTYFIFRFADGYAFSNPDTETFSA